VLRLNKGGSWGEILGDALQNFSKKGGNYL